MNNIILTALGVSIPLLGTTLGAGTVFFVRERLDPRLQRLLLGFASGVMLAASVWSLILPAIALAEASGAAAWLPPLAGFLLGCAFLLLPDVTARCGAGRRGKLELAVTLHNVPEGMAVGVVLAGLLSGGGLITWVEAYSLIIGIAIQNLPEGAIISLPLAAAGQPRGAAFLRGFFSGVVEPAAAVFTVLLTWLVAPILPYMLSFAAGAMIYAVVEELIPQAQEGKGGCEGTLGAVLGFALMMTLDVALG